MRPSRSGRTASSCGSCGRVADADLTQVLPSVRYAPPTCDALHRQIVNPVRNGLLLRENEQTAVEGSRRASGSHDTRSAPSAGSGDRSVPLPVEDPVQKARTADECRVPRTAQESSAPRRRRGRVGGRAQRRSLCAHGTRSMSEVSLQVWRHACTHDSLTHHAAWTACQAHVLAGASNAVEHLECRKLWLDKSWPVAVG